MKAELLLDPFRYGRPATPSESIDRVSRRRSAGGRGRVVVALGSLYFSGDIREAVEKLRK
jgi:hypothetical protein